jgi:hypothetical protein
MRTTMKIRSPAHNGFLRSENERARTTGPRMEAVLGLFKLEPSYVTCTLKSIRRLLMAGRRNVTWRMMLKKLRTRMICFHLMMKMKIE